MQAFFVRGTDTKGTRCRSPGPERDAVLTAAREHVEAGAFFSKYRRGVVPEEPPKLEEEEQHGPANPDKEDEQGTLSMRRARRKRRPLRLQRQSQSLRLQTKRWSLRHKKKHAQCLQSQSHWQPRSPLEAESLAFTMPKPLTPGPPTQGQNETTRNGEEPKKNLHNETN